MGLFTQALEQRSARYTTTNPRNPAYWVERLFGGGTMTATGIAVGEAEGWRVAAIYLGCRLVGEDIGGLPAPILLPDPKRPKASIEDRSHPAWRLLNRKPNPEMGALDFRGTLTGHAAIRGTAFAEKELDQGLRTRALWPLNPARMKMLRAGRDVQINGAPDGELAYVYTLPDGQEKLFRKELIFRLPGFGSNGLRGHSIITLAREGIALALAAEEYGARFYANNARPDFVLKHAGSPSPAAKKNLRESWDSSHRGLSNAHRVAILEEGLELEKIGMSNVDAEWVASQKQSVIQFARWLRINPTKLMDLDNSGDRANVEHLSIDYVQGIAPWALRWEQALDVHGVVDEPHYVKHTFNGLLRADLKTRSDYYHAMKLDGNLTANDVLALEDMPLSDAPAADELLVPQNMLPASSYDEHGMTYQQRVDAASALVRVGFEPAEALAALNLPPIAHTGLVPTSIQIDPTLLPKAQGGTQ